MSEVPAAVRAEFAPTGTLRVGINMSNFLLTAKDDVTGVPKGVAVDLGRELASRLGLPVEIVPYPNPGALADAAKTGAWDVGFLGAEPQRANEIDFTAAYVEIEATYLVPPGSPLKVIADVDRPGVRIAVPEKSAYELYLSRNLKQAKLVMEKGADNAFRRFTADKLDALAGLFGIGQIPTGDKDPFALRRAALGAIRILVERRLPLKLSDLLDAAFEKRREAGKGKAELEAFMFERARGYFREAGYSPQQVDAVLSMNPARFDLIPAQLEAVRAFAALPEAESLAAANKRVVNILKQAEAKGEALRTAEAAALQEPAERQLFEALQASRQKATPLFEQGDYTGYLKTFAVLKSPVDAFFDSVMVMVDEDATRRNRLALLRDLREAMNRVADLSKLAT